MRHARYRAEVLAPLIILLTFATGGRVVSAEAQAPVQGPATGADLYASACANCHGDDGTGDARTAELLDVEIPDFTDCSFATREPDADWGAVIHQGGPVRAFDRAMPAFGDALTEAEINLILGHVRTMCGDAAWPRGELNLPRALVTEKAYPEDEAVWTTTFAADGPGAVTNELVFEKRFGARNQVEFKVPFAAAQHPAGDWRFGAGDIAIGFKRALAHDLEHGTILSAAVEVILPTGDESAGAGSGVTIVEPFVSFGQILKYDSFFQAQVGFEVPSDTDRVAQEGFWRAAIGKTWTQGPYGRAWTPIVEVLGSHELGDDPETHWDLLPQVQVTLNQRQHVMLNVGVRVPLNDRDFRHTRVMVYLLWDWFDGGLFDGW